MENGLLDQQGALEHLEMTALTSRHTGPITGKGVTDANEVGTVGSVGGHPVLLLRLKHAPLCSVHKGIAAT